MADEATARSVSNCKRRGIARTSITRFNTKLKDLESKVDQPGTFDPVQQMKRKLETLDNDFKTHHYALVDLVDAEDEAGLKREQEALDDHDEIAALTVHVQQLISACTHASSSDANPRRIVSCRLAHIQRSLSSVNDAIRALTGDSDDTFVLRQHEEQLTDYKRELSDVHASLLSIDLNDGDELNQLLTWIKPCLTVLCL